MIINLTKLLDIKRYTGVYAETSLIGNLSRDKTSQEDSYSFELEVNYE